MVYHRILNCFPCSSVGKEPACSAGDPSLIPGSGRSLGEGNGNPLQYSGLVNPMDRRVYWATVHGIAKESDMTQPLNNNVHCMDKQTGAQRSSVTYLKPHRLCSEMGFGPGSLTLHPSPALLYLLIESLYKTASLKIKKILKEQGDVPVLTLEGNVLVDGKITWLKETSVLSAHPIGFSDQDLKDKRGSSED